MKKRVGVLTAIIALGFTVSCTGSQSQSAEKTAGEVKIESAVVQMSKADFLAKVMNYEQNTDKWVYEGERPCLIDFYADWCGPCRTTSPILEELAKEYKGKIDVYKVNVEKERELAAVFGVSGIPTFIYCPMEGAPQKMSGIARTAEETKEMFRNNIERILLAE